MSDDIILAVDNLGKRFKIYPHPWGRAWEWATLGKQVCHTDFWAIRNISFSLRRGGFLGIIGVNGAGKSTLLKIITGVLQATEGSCQRQGRVLSILELGLGLNERLTGRENVLTNAHLLGFPEEYARRQTDQIAEFSELGPFFEQPVATYSTGMRMRLAFSLFAFLDCDILILDEVMAVGDIFFQQKCYARLEELIAQKTAIILVSHDLNAIQQYCHEVIVLHQGGSFFQGPASEAIKMFVQARGVRTVKAIETTFQQNGNQPDDQAVQSDFFWPADEAFLPVPAAKVRGADRALLTRIAICDEAGQPSQAFKQGEKAVFYYEYELKKDIGVPIGSIELTNAYNLLLHSKTSLQHQMAAPNRAHAGSLIRFRQSISLGLAPGEYVFTLGLLAIAPTDYARLTDLSQEQLNQETIWVCRTPQTGAFVVTAGLGKGLAVLHGGLCDLPGDCQVALIEPANSG